jgi:hypothetical protein
MTASEATPTPASKLVTFSKVPSWVPADACRLPGDGQAARLAAFEGLFAASVLTVERAEETRLRLGLAADPAVAATVADLAMREADCCGFFTLTAGTGRLDLDITVPQPRAGVLDGIATQAEDARARA